MSMMLTEKDIWSSKVDFYHEARPKYHIGPVLQVLSDAPESPVVVELGAGTGRFTRPLLEQNNVVVHAVEPNQAMREKLTITCGPCHNLHIIDATAEETNLPIGFADLICSANSAHWFKIDAFKKECNRILKKNGKVILIWDLYAEDAATQEYDYLMHNSCATKNVIDVKGKIDAIILSNFFSEYKKIVYNFDYLYDFSKILKLAQSTHCTPIEGEPGYHFMFSKLQEWFNKYQQNGFVKLCYNTTLYKGNL